MANRLNFTLPHRTQVLVRSLGSKTATIGAIGLLLVSSFLTIIVSVSPTASADTLNYPWYNAPCEFDPNGGSHCTNPTPCSPNTDCYTYPNSTSDLYDWYENGGNGFTGTDCWYGTNSECFDSTGYEYRNCTSYTAWRLMAVGVASSKVKRLGNGGQWYDSVPSSEQSTTPKAWDAAVVPGGIGHVAFVESVNSDGTITVSEYNHDRQGNGDTWTGTASSRGFTEFVDFGVHPTPPPPPPPPTYPLTLSADYDDSTGLTEVFSGDQKNNMLRETSWLYGQTPQTVSISASISGNIVDIASFVVNGWRHLYTATSTGAIYETVWQAGQSPTTWQVGTVPNVVGIAATYDSSNGLTEVFSVDSGRNIDETYWLYNQTPQTIGITQLPSGTTPTSIGAILYNGYRHVEVSTKEGPVTETVWQAGQSPTTWQIGNVPNAVGVDAAMAGTVTEVFTLDSSNRVNETYWDYGQQPQSDIVTTLPGVTASDIATFVTASGYRHVYGSTADTPHAINETWWYPTQSATTWTVTSF